MSTSLKTSLANLLREARQQKLASAGSEPGSIGGETSHPIKSVDDNTAPQHEGARSQENTKDVKKDQGPAGVESAPKTVGPQETAQESIGPLSSKTTGKDPASETESAKGSKDDPGTAHPATTEDGKKFGSASEQLAYISARLEKLATVILSAHIKSSQKAAEAPAPAAAPATTPAPASKETAGEVEKAAAAGYDLAGLLANTGMPLRDKAACDRVVFDMTRDAVNYGVKLAEAYMEVSQGFFANKHADDETGEPGAEHHQEPDADDQGVPGEAEAAGGDVALDDAGMPSEEELLAMLAGGGGDMGGGDGGGGEELPPEAMGGGGGGGGGGAEAIDPAMLQQILQALGIDPAMLEQKAAAVMRTKTEKTTDKSAAKRRFAAAILDLMKN